MHIVNRSFSVLLLLVSVALGQEPPPPAFPPGYRLLYASHFDAGLDRAIGEQKPAPDSIVIVDAPDGSPRKSLRVTLQKSEDYTHVANGAPRSELSFGRLFRLEPGKDYLVEWSTFLPVDHQFDLKQLESITQIHHGLPIGSPPFMLAMHGENYEVIVLGLQKDDLKKATHPIGSARADLGHWVKWRLHYVADFTGTQSVTELFKNGAQVINANGEPNAYIDDRKAYWKMGIYKWNWQKNPSDVTTRTIFYGDLTVAVKD
jgi:hypothetical protein